MIDQGKGVEMLNADLLMGRTIAVLALEILALGYPVGSIYISVNSTNPATSLGFGTWSAFGVGRVPVGFDGSDTDFDTDEETGGAKTVASNVTVATQPTFTVNSHAHNLSDNGWAYNTIISGVAWLRRLAVAAWTPTHKATLAFTADTTSQSFGSALGGATDATAGTATTRTADVALTNNAVSVQQKYIVVRMWKRTA